MCHFANFVQIVQTVTDIWPFFDFQDGGRLLPWICFTPTLYHPGTVVGGLCHCANFNWNRQFSFEDKQISMSCEFGLKMPIH